MTRWTDSFQVVCVLAALCISDVKNEQPRTRVLPGGSGHSYWLCILLYCCLNKTNVTIYVYISLKNRGGNSNGKLHIHIQRLCTLRNTVLKTLDEFKVNIGYETNLVIEQSTFVSHSVCEIEKQNRWLLCILIDDTMLQFVTILKTVISCYKLHKHQKCHPF